MKFVKIFGGIILLIVALLAVLFIYVLTNLGTIVKDVVEDVGPRITQTPVHLDSVDIALREGRGQLGGFAVENPEGYSSENLFTFDNVVLQIEPRSIAEPVKVLNEVTVQGVQITAEQKGLTTNLQQVLKNIQAAGGPGEEEPPTEQAEVRLMVEELNFTEGSIKLITEKYGEYDVPLPKVELANLGDRDTGLTPSQLGKAVMEPLIQQAQRAVEQRLEDVAREKVEEEVQGKVEEKLKEKLGEDADEKAEELKKLFGK